MNEEKKVLRKKNLKLFFPRVNNDKKAYIEIMLK